MKRKVISKDVHTFIDAYDIDGKTVEELITRLQEEQKNAKAMGFTRVRLNHHGWDSPEFSFIYERDETDEELEQRREKQRIANEKRKKSREMKMKLKQDAEYKKYIELKEKYGKVDN